MVNIERDQIEPNDNRRGNKTHANAQTFCKFWKPPNQVDNTCTENTHNAFFFLDPTYR